MHIGLRCYIITKSIIHNIMRRTKGSPCQGSLWRRKRQLDKLEFG